MVTASSPFLSSSFSGIFSHGSETRKIKKVSLSNCGAKVEGGNIVAQILFIVGVRKRTDFCGRAFAISALVANKH